MTNNDPILHNLNMPAKEQSRKGLLVRIKDIFGAIVMWAIILTFFIPVIPIGGSWLWDKINSPQPDAQNASFIRDPDVQGDKDYEAPEYEDRDYDCGDFSTHAEAQDFFDSAGAGDPHRLDRDGDGSACETLP